MRIFVSYSHDDPRWYRRVRDYLKSVEGDNVEVWSDEDIKPGQRWFDEIQKAVAATDVAVLLVTNDYVISDFIDEHELTPFVEAAARDELDLVWIAIGSCLWELTPLEDLESVNDPERPLEGMSKAERNRTLTDVARSVLELARAREARRPV